MLVTRASSNGTPDTTVTTAGATANTSGLGGSSSSIAEDENISDTDETINIDESFHFNEDNEQNFERNETDINEIDWTQAQGITPDSSLAWALDGHIRMRNEVSSRLIPPTGLVIICLFRVGQINSCPRLRPPPACRNSCIGGVEFAFVYELYLKKMCIKFNVYFYV